MLTNGPGDPKSLPEAIKMIQGIQGKVPIFGICLGHQLFSLANGADTYKMKFGHRGLNHPVERSPLVGSILPHKTMALLWMKHPSIQKN